MCEHVGVTSMCTTLRLIHRDVDLPRILPTLDLRCTNLCDTPHDHWTDSPLPYIYEGQDYTSGRNRGQRCGDIELTSDVPDGHCGTCQPFHGSVVDGQEFREEF